MLKFKSVSQPHKPLRPLNSKFERDKFSENLRKERFNNVIYH